MKIVNLTSHTLNEVTTGNSYPPSGIVARVVQTTKKTAEHDNIPIFTSVYGAVDGLPEPLEDTLYVVSAMTLAQVALTRTDVVAPGNLQRNENGQPIGCVGFRSK